MISAKWRSACVEALTKAKMRHGLRVELDSLNTAQRATVQKATQNGWVPNQVVNGIVVMTHPNLESFMEIDDQGRYERRKKVSVKV